MFIWFVQINLFILPACNLRWKNLTSSISHANECVLFVLSGCELTVSIFHVKLCAFLILNRIENNFFKRLFEPCVNLKAI